MLRAALLGQARLGATPFLALASSQPLLGVSSRRFFSQQSPSASNVEGNEGADAAQAPTSQVSEPVQPSAEALEMARRLLTSPEFFDQPQLNQKAKQEAIAEFRRHPVDTGSSEVQVAVLSERIIRLQAHFEKNKKDIHSRRGLMELMQRRRKLLLYMASRDPEAYVRVIEKYQIREGKGPSRVSDRPEDWSPPRNKEDVKYRPKTWLEFKAGTGKDIQKKA